MKKAKNNLPILKIVKLVQITIESAFFLYLLLPPDPKTYYNIMNCKDFLQILKIILVGTTYEYILG